MHSRSSVGPGLVLALCCGLALAGAAYWLLLGNDLVALNIVLGASCGCLLLSVLAWRNLALLVAIWLFSMAGFRAMAMVQMPGVPDLSPERVIAVWIILLFTLRLMSRRESLRGPFVLDALLVLHTCYVLANLMVLGEGGHTNRWLMSSVMPLAAYLVGKNIMQRDQEVRVLLIFFLAVTVYFASQSLAQRYDWQLLIWPREIVDQRDGLWQVGRSRGPFQHAPLFGQVLGMVMLVQFYFFHRVRGDGWRLLLVVSIVLSVLGLVFTYTRAPWLATMCGLLTLTFLRPRYHKLVLGLGVLVGLLVFGAGALVQDEGFLKERFATRSTIDNRLAVLSAAVRMSRDHPVTGIGYFNWTEVSGDYLRGEQVPLYGYIKRRAARRMVPHDIYWSRLAEEGLVSLVLLGWALGVAGLRLRKLWSMVPDHAWLNRDGLALFVAMVVCYLVGGAFIDYRYFDLVNVIPYLLAGILYGYQVPPARVSVARASAPAAGADVSRATEPLLERPAGCPAAEPAAVSMEPTRSC